MWQRIGAHGLRGFAMGAADVVPGVSGGTVALVLGIYPRLIDNVRRGASALGKLAKADLRGFVDTLVRIEWLFLVPLLAGVGSAFLVLRHPIENLLVDRPEEIAGVFCGLVAASVLVAWRDLDLRDTARLATVVGVGAVTFVALGFQAGAVTDPSLLVFTASGAIAICAMILPGISGSFLLLMLGMYGAVLGGSAVELGALLVGAVVGLALFSTLLGWLLDTHRQIMIAALIGLMIGSFRVLWPWPNGVGFISEHEEETVSGTDLTLPSLGDAVVPVVLGVIAAAVVLIVSSLAIRHADTDHAGVA